MYNLGQVSKSLHASVSFSIKQELTVPTYTSFKVLKEKITENAQELLADGNYSHANVS
jgi:hypothetical protein